MADTPLIVDGVSEFSKGINSGIAPLLIPKNQLAFAINATVRGAFITHRPTMRKIILDFGGDANLQESFTKSLWQGGCFYNPDAGNASLVAAIGGRLFLVTPSVNSNTAVVTDISIIGDLNPVTQTQAWLWQAERWVIVNDGLSLPIFYDGSFSRRSYGPSVQLAIVDAPGFTAPAQGDSVQVNVTVPYSGPFNIPVKVVDGTHIATYTLKEPAPGPAVPNARLKMIHTTGPVTANTVQNIIAGRQVFAIPSRIGVVFGGGIPPAATLASLGLTNPPDNQQIEFYSTTNTPSSVPISTWNINSKSFAASKVFDIFTPATFDFYLSAIGHVGSLLASGDLFDKVITDNNPNPNTLIGTVVTPFTTPARLATIDVVLDTPYTGADDQPVWIGDYIFLISKVPPPGPTVAVTLVNQDDTPGHVYPAATTKIFSIAELPPGRMGVYGLGRNWVSLIDGRSFMGSDIVASTSGSIIYQFRDSVLKTTENDYLAGGGNFVVPGSVGDIRAMIFTATLDSSLGQGALQVGTPTTIFSCNAPVDRSTWQNLTNPILTESLKGLGPLGQNSTILVNSDTLFRSVIGLGSLILARREFATWGNVPISREIERIIKFDSISLLGFGSAAAFGNRLLETAFPTPSSLGVFHQGTIALNFDPISNLGGKSASVYDGLWLGINTLQWVRGLFNGTERAFSFCFNRATTEIELYELQSDGAARFDHDGEEDVRIKWSFETSSLFAEVKGKNWFDLVELQDGEFFVSDVVGNLDFQVFYKPQFHPCWVLWHEGSICATPRNPALQSDDNVQPQNRVSVGLGRPDMSICDPVNNRPYGVGETFQIKFVFTGTCKFYGAVFRASLFPKSTFEKVACGPICIGPADSDCEDCKKLECVADNDFQLYTLQDRLPVVPTEEVFNDAVFFEHGCGDGSTLEFSGTLPNWISLDADNSRLVGAAGTYRAASKQQANFRAQRALDEFGNGALDSGDLSCSGACEAPPFDPQFITDSITNAQSSSNNPGTFCKTFPFNGTIGQVLNLWTTSPDISLNLYLTDPDGVVYSDSFSGWGPGAIAGFARISQAINKNGVWTIEVDATNVAETGAFYLAVASGPTNTYDLTPYSASPNVFNAMAYAPTSQKLFLSTPGTNKVLFFDPALGTGTVITLTDATKAWFVCYGSAQDKIYVAYTQTGTLDTFIQEIDPATGALGAAYTAGIANPSTNGVNMSYDATRDRLLVILTVNSAVATNTSVVDCVSHAVLFSGNPAGNILRWCACSNDNYYLTSGNSNTLYKIDPATFALTTSAFACRSFSTIFFIPELNVLVAVNSANHLAIVDPDTDTELASFTDSSSISGCAYDSCQNEIRVSKSNNRQLLVIDSLTLQAKNNYLLTVTANGLSIGAFVDFNSKTYVINSIENSLVQLP